MKKTILALSLSTFALVACSKPAPTTADTTSSTSTSETQAQAANTQAQVDSTTLASDWSGEYEGTLPCADCEGIKTQLEFHPNQAYELKEEYKGKGKDNEFKVNGNFTVDSANPSMITLDQAGDNRKFRKEGNNLYALDSNGKKVEGALASHYILTKD
ncbi:copper resistance protein NlpE [Alkanindiges sp. WGS2144]|uniref:copper resistance protein NlpE n=1 Tax=Alkanindiges sp. WGS2144 TaxID=3366808 RepID=UPI0037530429